MQGRRQFAALDPGTLFYLFILPPVWVGVAERVCLKGSGCTEITYFSPHPPAHLKPGNSNRVWGGGENVSLLAGNGRRAAWPRGNSAET